MYLLRVVVDQLPVDEDIHVVGADEVDLVLHLLLLSQLDLGHLADVVHLDSGAEHLDLVGVHRRVGDQDLGILNPLWLVHAHLLVQEETWWGNKVRIRRGKNIVKTSKQEENLHW